jgi:hypothetical protein
VLTLGLGASPPTCVSTPPRYPYLQRAERECRVHNCVPPQVEHCTLRQRVHREDPDHGDYSRRHEIARMTPTALSG